MKKIILLIALMLTVTPVLQENVCAKEVENPTSAKTVANEITTSKSLEEANFEKQLKMQKNKIPSTKRLKRLQKKNFKTSNAKEMRSV